MFCTTLSTSNWSQSWQFSYSANLARFCTGHGSRDAVGVCAHTHTAQYSTESLACACSPIYIFNANPYCHEELVWHRVSRKDCAPQQSTPSRPALHQMRLSEGNAVVCVSQSQPLELSPLGLQKTLHRLCALHSGSVSRTRQARLNCSCYFACFKVDGCGCN